MSLHAILPYYGQVEIDVPLPDIIPAVGTKNWPRERDLILIRLAYQGCSASQIAVALGDCTRNSIIGRVRRINQDLTKLDRPEAELHKYIQLKGGKGRRNKLAGPKKPRAQKQNRVQENKNDDRNVSGVRLPDFAIDREGAGPDSHFHCVETVDTPQGKVSSVLLNTDNHFFHRAGKKSCQWKQDTSAGEWLGCTREVAHRKPYCEEHSGIVYKPKPADFAERIERDLTRLSRLDRTRRPNPLYLP